MNRIAILAGGGRLPLVLADSIASAGGRAHIVAVRGEAGPEVEAYPHTWVTWGSVNAILASLKRESDGVMMIAGSVSRPDLKRLKPDFGLIRHLPDVLAMLRGGDDAVLTRLIRFFEAQGLTVKGVSDVAPQLLAKAGSFGAPATSVGQTAADIAMGFRVLDTLADLDVGQAIAVENGRVLAIEGVEGTDRMLGRLADLRDQKHGRGVLVKGPKRGQDLRVDVPTVGARTIAGLRAAQLGTLAIVAAKTLLMDRAQMLEAATAAAITIECVDRELRTPDNGAIAIQHPTMDTAAAGRLLGRCAPSAADRRDVLTAIEVTRRLVPFATGCAAAVVRDHVLAVAAAEGAVAMARRAADLRQWGRNRARRGAVGVFFEPTRDSEQQTLEMIDVLQAAGLAGLAVARSPGSVANDLPASIVAAADRAGLFLIDIASADDPLRAGATV